jgi:hypothetical protein
MVKVVNVRDLDPDAYNIYIGRKTTLSKLLFKDKPWLIDGTDLGNHVKLSDSCSREESIAAHREYFLENTNLFSNLLETLKNIASSRTVCLACWCSPKCCHGDVIAEYLNESISGPVPEIVSENLFEE